MIITWDDAIERFNEFLDLEEKPVIVAGQEFDRSRIFRELDPTGYRSHLFNFVDAEGIDSDDLVGELTV